MKNINQLKNAPKSSLKICGLVFCYNEEDIIEENIKYYLSLGIDLVVFDNCSTDQSKEIVLSLKSKAITHGSKIIDFVEVRTNGYEWKKILKTACTYMHEKLFHYDWILLIDADGFYESPVRDKDLVEFISEISSSSYNVINGRLFNFFPTEKDDPNIISHIERIKYYEHKEECEEKIFKYKNDIDFYSSYGHFPEFKEKKVYPFTRFNYRHYPWRSYEHGLKKIFKDRKPRFVEKNEDIRLHSHYSGILPLYSDLVKKSETLIEYVEKNQKQSMLIYKMKYFVQKIKNIIIKKLSEAKKIVPHGIKSKIYNVKSTNKIKKLNPSVAEYPKNYHFLLTDFCNAKCTFCNQKFIPGDSNQLTLENFKKMADNAQLRVAKVVNLSGGGDPLLCMDLPKIIEYLNANYPKIEIRLRTNGLLLKRLAPNLRALNFTLEVSIHGQLEINNKILRKNNSSIVFEGIKELTRLKQEIGHSLRLSIHSAISKVNLDEIIPLMHFSKELGAQSYHLGFQRFHEYRLNDESLQKKDSLYFYQEQYDEIARSGKKIANKIDIKFYPAPLFSEKFKQSQCDLPWTSLVIHWNGTVYPCPGGESWFYDEVKSGEYNFGNLLKNPLSEIWESDTFTKIRRTCASDFKEPFIPKCENCHNEVCFSGPQKSSAHFSSSLDKQEFKVVTDKTAL